MTYDETKSYIGGTLLQQRIMRYSPFFNRFNYPAYEHDVAYAAGGDEFDRAFADVDFYKNMLLVSGKNPFAIALATLYYVIVRVFGGSHFVNE